MEPDDRVYRHALRTIAGIGDGTLTRLITHFGSGEAAWLADADALAAVPKLSSEKQSRLITDRKAINPLRLWNSLATLYINALTPEDADYPALLKEIPDHPGLIYTRGSFDWQSTRPLIAIVGSRKHSSYGVQVATQIATDLTRAGYVIVSGMAFGIDSVAHKAALTAPGDTIAVLGSGIDDNAITPVTHLGLAKNIMAHGALLSEYPPGTPPSQGSFPMRDRLIAGLTVGTLVIEAGEQSGSLITAHCALDYNREVFAVPGSIFSPYSIGTNALIKRGAKVVTGIQDILEELGDHTRTTTQSTLRDEMLTTLSDAEKQLYHVLTEEPIHVDKIIKASRLTTQEASALLTILEMKGLAKNVGGMHYVRVA